MVSSVSLPDRTLRVVCPQITAGVRHCVTKAGKRHILNLGHGVLQGTPERAVQAFVDAANAM